jgi:hypothetical protein
MAKKTVFRRLSKWLPLSPDIRDAVDARPQPPRALLPAPARVDSEPGMLADMLAEAAQGQLTGEDDLPTFDDDQTAGASTGEESQVADQQAAGEEAQVAAPEIEPPPGNQLSQVGLQFVKRFSESAGNYEKLLPLNFDLVKTYKDRLHCVDPEGLWLYQQLDELIAEAK